MGHAGGSGIFLINSDINIDLVMSIYGRHKQTAIAMRPSSHVPHCAGQA
jgi:hypothetical protein